MTERSQQSVQEWLKDIRPRIAAALNHPELVPPQADDFAERFAASVDALVIDEAKAVGCLLDWVGVAAMSPLRERVLVLVAEYLSRTGQMDLDEAFAAGREVMDSEAVQS